MTKAGKDLSVAADLKILCMQDSHHTEKCNSGCIRKAVPNKEAAVSPGKVLTMSLECCFVFQHIKTQP